MSMTSPQQEARCEICGQEFASQEEAAEHLANSHGGPSGREPGGTGGLDPSFGSGPTGTTTSGSRPSGDMPPEQEDGGGDAGARDSDTAGGTVEQTEGGAGRVQTE
jgi:hypothetical protein